MGHSSLEVEAKLIIYSEMADEIAGKIADLTSVGEYGLLPAETLLIRDTYFDTPDRVLETREIALRVRAIGQIYWVTLKGPSGPSGGGAGTQRIEIEAPWSLASLGRVLKELSARGLSIFREPATVGHAKPLESLLSQGLQIVQCRETRRQVRNVVPAGDQRRRVVAELAVDSVTYRFARSIRHHEVEIEAKATQGPEAVETIARALMVQYGAELRKWDYSKLAIGKAIERLLNEGALEDLLEDDGQLTPAAFDLVERYLKGTDD